MRVSHSRLKSCILAGVLSMCCVSLAVAQSATGASEVSIAGEDAPDRVARLAHLEGEVTLAPAGADEWAEAVLNRPLTHGDRVWVEQGGRAELQTGSTVIRLDGNTGFAFIDLSDDALQMEVVEGAVVVHVRRKRSDERIEIDTPNAVVSLLEPGEYHLQVAADGEESIVRVRHGAAKIDGERDTHALRTGEQGVFRGTGALTADIGAITPRTGLEDWASEREHLEANAESARYVSRDVIGYEDLDRHGEWVHEPEYGHVWRPIHVSSNWAPYRDGRWVWVAPWGWTWVDAAPWGFAPFHYGRWAYLRSRWCWVPGPIHVRPVYAPALVGWIGSPGASVSVSFGSVGWYPLAPREIYVPRYWHSRHYIRRVNVSNTLIVNNIYVDRIYDGRRYSDYRFRHLPYAVTAVHREHFISGGRLHDRHLRLSARELRQWRHEPRTPALAPVRASVLAGRTMQPRALPRIEARSRLVAERRGLPTRVSFNDERRVVETNGRPPSRTELFGRNHPRTPSVGTRPAISRSEIRSQTRALTPRQDRDVSRESHVLRPGRDRLERDGVTNGTVRQWRGNERNSGERRLREERAPNTNANESRRRWEDDSGSIRALRPSGGSERRAEPAPRRSDRTPPPDRPRYERSPIERSPRVERAPRSDRSSRPERAPQLFAPTRRADPAPRVHTSPRERAAPQRHSAPRGEGRRESSGRASGVHGRQER